MTASGLDYSGEGTRVYYAAEMIRLNEIIARLMRRKND